MRGQLSEGQISAGSPTVEARKEVSGCVIRFKHVTTCSSIVCGCGCLLKMTRRCDSEKHNRVQGAGSGRCIPSFHTQLIGQFSKKKRTKSVPQREPPRKGRQKRTERKNVRRSGAGVIAPRDCSQDRDTVARQRLGRDSIL